MQNDKGFTNALLVSTVKTKVQGEVIMHYQSIGLLGQSKLIAFNR